MYPFPPPVTEASQQLRQETLLLFYQSCKFIIETGINGSSQSGVGPRLIRQPKLLMAKNTKDLFSLAPDEFLGNIRKLCVEGVVYSPTHWVSTEWYVEIKVNGGVSIQVGKAQCRQRDIPVGYEKAREKVEARMRTELETIAAREGNAKLQRQDLEAFRRALKAGDE